MIGIGFVTIRTNDKYNPLWRCQLRTTPVTCNSLVHHGNSRFWVGQAHHNVGIRLSLLWSPQSHGIGIGFEELFDFLFWRHTVARRRMMIHLDRFGLQRQPTSFADSNICAFAVGVNSLEVKTSSSRLLNDGQRFVSMLCHERLFVGLVNLCR